MTDEPYDATLLGMELPSSVKARIVTAFRALYPTLTQNKPNDDAAVLAVLNYWTAATLAQYEGSLAAPPIEEVVAEVTAQHREKVEEAATKAFTDASKIRNPNAPTQEVTP